MNNLYAIRPEKGMTQSKLAELSGINARQIRKIESGEIKTRNITIGTIIALAHALGVGIEELIDEEFLERYQELHAAKYGEELEV